MPDPLWEKYYGWTPWQYSYNNPLGFKDDNGEAPFAAILAPPIIGVGFGAAIIHSYKMQTDPAYRNACVKAGKDAFDAAVEGVSNVLNAVAGETKELKAPLKNQGEAGVPPPPDLGDGDKKGTKNPSKNLWESKGKDGGRLDWENPAPGKRPGQIHFQQNGNKYIYDSETNAFRGMPNKMQKRLMKDPNFRKAIDKGLRFIGE